MSLALISSVPVGVEPVAMVLVEVEAAEEEEEPRQRSQDRRHHQRDLNQE